MSAPALGSREEPLGAASEDLSDEENAWGSDFDEADDDGRSFDYDEDGEGIYDMPEYLPEESTQEYVYDENGEGIYDVPEFLPEEPAPSQRQNAPPIPRDKKPTVVPPQRAELENHTEEDYLAPEELTVLNSSPVPPRPLNRPPVRNELREAFRSPEEEARKEGNTVGPAIPLKPDPVALNQLSKPIHRYGAGQTDQEQVIPNITSRKPAQPVPQRPKPGLKPNLLGKSLERDAVKLSETLNSLQRDSEDHESVVGSRCEKENLRVGHQIPRPGPKPQNVGAPPSVSDDFYELATNDSKPSSGHQPKVPPPNRGAKPLNQKRDVSVPLASPVISDDVYELADDTKPKISSHQPKMPPPILGKKPANPKRNIAVLHTKPALAADTYELAEDSRPKVTSRQEKMPPPIPGGGKPSREPLRTTRSPRESVKRFEPEAADPVGGDSTDVYQIADQPISTGQTENFRPQLPIPTKETTVVAPEASLPPRPSKFSLSRNSRNKAPPRLPNASSMDPHDVGHGPSTAYSPPRIPSSDPTENYEVMQGAATHPSSRPYEEQAAYESMNSADPSGNSDLGSFAGDRILESNKFSGVHRNHSSKMPPPKLSGKSESLRSNVSGKETYEVADFCNQQISDHNQNHTVEQETYEVVSDNKNEPKLEPEMYEVPNEFGPKPKPLKRPPPLQSRKESLGFNSETSFDSEDDYITPINGPQEKGPVTCVRDKPRPPVVPRDANPGEIKREDSSGSGKNSSLKEKLKAKFSTGSSKKTQPEKPTVPARQDHVREENEPMISLEDLQKISVSGKPAPIMPSRICRPPTKPGRTSSQSESMQEVMNYSEWYHGGLARVEAERKLTTHRKEGMFIVRDTEKGHGYSLSFYADGAVRHLRINHHADSNKYNLGSYAQKFKSVVELIQHFQENAFEVKKREGSNSRGGGLARLTLACPK